MATEDDFDRIYALYVANNVMIAQLWAYVSALGAQLYGMSPDEFLKHQAETSRKNVDLWQLENHPNPEQIRALAKSTIESAFSGLIEAAAVGRRQ